MTYVCFEDSGQDYRQDAFLEFIEPRSDLSKTPQRGAIAILTRFEMNGIAAGSELSLGDCGGLLFS
jgi:hypothetical protein